jgi:hypothetical protein
MIIASIYIQALCVHRVALVLAQRFALFWQRRTLRRMRLSPAEDLWPKRTTFQQHLQPDIPLDAIRVKFHFNDQAVAMSKIHRVHDLGEQMHESSISGYQNHMQAFLCRTASHLQKRAIPAALTREAILGSVVELHNCGNFDVDSLPCATKVRGLCEIPDVMLDFTAWEISAPILVATAASHMRQCCDSDIHHDV